MSVFCCLVVLLARLLDPYGAVSTLNCLFLFVLLVCIFFIVLDVCVYALHTCVPDVYLRNICFLVNT